MDKNNMKKLFCMLQMLHVMRKSAVIISNIKVKERRRRWWVRDVNRSRNLDGYFNIMFKQMKMDDPEKFFNETRMEPPVYDLLLNILKNKLTKHSIRTAISAECRLALTLRYLSQGISHHGLALSFKMGKTTVRKIILETCDVIWKTLSPIYVKEPTLQDYEIISQNFNDLCDLPNCVGSVAGKNINLKWQENNGTSFKQKFNVSLIAACDTNYTFTSIEVGTYEIQSEEIRQKFGFEKNLMTGNLPLPADRDLPGSNILFPFYFVADTFFPLKNNLMRPFPGKQLCEIKATFNSRLSTAQSTIENAFGILVARWRVLRTTLECCPSNAEKIILATIALHNFIMSNDETSSYCPENFVDWEDENGVRNSGEWRKVVQNDGGALKPLRMRSNNAPVDAFHKRQVLADYLINEGANQQQENQYNTIKYEN